MKKRIIYSLIGLLCCYTLLGAYDDTNQISETPHDDKMEEAIKNIDPDSLNKLLIPGLIMTAADKKKYVAMSREITNKTYKDLYSYSLSDIVRFARGVIKGGIGAAGLAGLYFYHQGTVDLSQWQVRDKKSRIISSQEITDKQHIYSVYAILGGLSLYFLHLGGKELSDIMHKKNRMKRHRDALINEAVLQRLPVSEVGTSESILL